MKLFDGLNQVERLPLGKRLRFKKFLNHQIKYRVLPLCCDLSLVLTLIGTVIHILILIESQGLGSVHALNYLNLAILILIAVCHQYKPLRRLAPCVVYLVFANMAIFTYLGYLATKGDITTIVGLFFFLSSLGFITLSLKHTLIILGTNILILILASKLIRPDEGIFTITFSLVSNWFIFMCLIVAPLSACFNRWFLEQLFALQYLLNDRNRLLGRTLKSLKHTEQALINQQKNKALSHMAAGLLHEIINPLNSANQALQYAKSIEPGEEVKEAVSEAMLHQDRIVQLVSDLKQFSKPNQALILEKTDVVKLLEKALSFCRPSIKHIQTNNKLPQNISLKVHAPSILQVFTNIINNAARAMAEKPNPILTINARKLANSIELVFEDNGCGIEENTIEQLTEPFYSTSEAPDNIGLGLSICQTVMRHHDGHIKIESELGHWTRVSLHFNSRD